MSVWSVRLNLTLPTIPAMPTAGMVARIRGRFQHDAGVLILDAIRNHLGQSSLYTLSPEYAARKSSMKRFTRFSGKASDQPLILSGQGIYNALTVIPSGDGFVVQVEDSAGVDDGFDYAEYFEEITHYLELGLDDVEDQLPELLCDIIVDEMGL